jgi:hypothetical protein
VEVAAVEPQATGSGADLAVTPAPHGNETQPDEPHVEPSHAEPAPPAPPARVEPAVASRPPAKVVTSAKVAIANLSVRGALTRSQISRAVSRALPAVRGCYASAALAAHRSPTATLRVSFAIDESQNASSVRIDGGDLAGLGRCVEHALATIRTEAAPDVGTVDVALTLTFTPDGP